MSSLESIELVDCRGLSNTGLAQLAYLPRLREVTIGGSPKVTRDCGALFPAHVRVSYSP
jgi:hypothetical protein